jgi:ABC-2 type transport system ATP-binding protein
MVELDKVPTAISVQGVSKTFKLPNEKTSSIKSAVINVYRRKRSFEKQRVLDDITFEIKEGEFFGIVGRNGSGKSTLLKLLAGIYSPDKGAITVSGKLTPFIELGVGFNPELTGRENVFLNGALLGFSRKEMRAMYEDIVRFAELGRFMDQKLKNYSSGMQVRLAFSIAIRVKSDVLILDEVLAVGDEAFQQKCVDVFERYKAQKQTVVLVTHDMEVVRRFCSRAMLLDKGEIIAMGAPTRVAGDYSKMNDTAIGIENKAQEVEKEKKSDIHVKMTNTDRKSVTNFALGDWLNLDITWPSDRQGVKNVGVAIVKQTGEFVFGANTFGHRHKLDSSSISYSVKLQLGPGKYYLMVGLFGKSEREVVEFLDDGPQFTIQQHAKDTQTGFARLEHEWKDSR